MEVYAWNTPSLVMYRRTEKINWWSFSSGSNRRLNTLQIETKKTNCKGRSGQKCSSARVYVENDRADRTIKVLARIGFDCNASF